MLGPEQQVGRRRTIEAEAALARLVQGHERQRGLGLRGSHGVAHAHAEAGQRLMQEVAEHVLPQHPHELAVRAQARGGHRDIGRRAAGILLEGAGLAFDRRLGQQVDQHLAETD